MSVWSWGTHIRRARFELRWICRSCRRTCLVSSGCITAAARGHHNNNRSTQQPPLGSCADHVPEPSILILLARRLVATRLVAPKLVERYHDGGCGDGGRRDPSEASGPRPVWRVLVVAHVFSRCVGPHGRRCGCAPSGCCAALAGVCQPVAVICQVDGSRLPGLPHPGSAACPDRSGGACCGGRDALVSAFVLVLRGFVG